MSMYITKQFVSESQHHFWWILIFWLGFPFDVFQDRVVRFSISFFSLKGIYEHHNICQCHLSTLFSLAVRSQ